MSVLVSDRTESKFEAITYSIELHDMLIDFMQRSFGVKDLDQLVRVRYAHGKTVTPSTKEQTVLPDSEEGYNYLSQVTVKAIPYNESENPAGGTTVTIG